MSISRLARAMRGGAVLGLLLAFPGGAAVGGATGGWGLVQGTTWGGPGTLKAKFEGQGTLVGPADFVLDFGPLPALGIGPDEFEILVDDGAESISFGGAYVEPAPGHYRLLPSATSYAGTWCDFFLDGGAEDCGIEVQKMKMGAKAKQTDVGESLRFGFSSRSIATITMFGETTTTTMKVSIKGSASR